MFLREIRNNIFIISISSKSSVRDVKLDKNNIDYYMLMLLAYIHATSDVTRSQFDLRVGKFRLSAAAGTSPLTFAARCLAEINPAG